MSVCVLEIAKLNNLFVGTLIELAHGQNPLVRQPSFAVKDHAACQAAARLLGYHSHHIPEVLTKRFYVDPVFVVDRWA